MTEFTSGQIHDFSNGLLDNPEFQLLYESFLTAEDSGDLQASCPMLGIQTQAESTSKTGSLRDDGVSSLPLTCRLDVDVGLRSPLETTVLDSSSPLDGVPLSYLLHAVVELTSTTLPTNYQCYCGNFGLIVEIDEQSLQVCVEIKSDLTRINIANSRMLKLSSPMPGDTVRVIRGENASTVGSMISQHDNSQVLVKTDKHSSPLLFLSCDIVRLDLSSVERDTPTCTSSPPSIGMDNVDESSGFSQANVYSPSYSTEWRINSPIPSSPMDSLVSNNLNPSPSSSLVGNVTSPGNPWSVSSSSSIPDYAYCLSSDSSASSSNTAAPTNNSIQQQQQQTVQSLPTPPTINGLSGNNNYSCHDHYQNAPPTYTSLPNNHYTSMKQQPSPTFAYPLGDSAHHKPTSPPGNLYPVITGDTVYMPQSNIEMSSPSASCINNGYQNGQSNGYNNISYPTLPSYAAVTTPCNIQCGSSWTNIAMVNCNQSPQYTPMLLSNGYTMYQQVQPQQYQSLGAVTQPPLCNDQYTTSKTIGGNLYPQLQPTSQMTTPTNRQSYLRQPYSTNQVTSTCKTGLVNRFKNLQAGSRKKQGLYPQLPLNGKPQETKETPWDEFKSLINSIQCRQSCKPLSLESVIDTAIEGLSTKSPPQQWYNPLAAMEDDSCESDLSTESVRVSALCPLIKQRMDYPCRGLYCKHLQCFDAKAFLKLALKRRSQLVSNLRGSSSTHSSSHPDNGWKCPMCGKIVSVNQLYIERYLQKAINEFNSVTELEFKGIEDQVMWVPYQKCHEPSNTVIDLTMDSDDEL